MLRAGGSGRERDKDMGIYQSVALDFSDLKRGDIVRHKGTHQVFTVTANYGSRVTAAATADLTNPSEWEVFRMPAPETPVVYDPHDHTHAAYVRSQETRSVDMSDQPMGDPHPADLTRNAQCPVCGCTLGYHKWNCTLNQL